MAEYVFTFSISSLIFLFAFQSITFAHPIDHCEFLQVTSEPKQTPSCIKCLKDHILDSTGTICQQKSLQYANCIQLSIFEECQRCDCGFSLSNNQNSCVPSPIQYIGCEVLDKDSICVRPKSEFVLLKINQTISKIEYARGSHCEIFDITKGQCEQCHSGFKLQSPSNECHPHSHKLVNEHESYFSQDGQLNSRRIDMIASHQGVFPKINYCEKQSSKEINSTYQAFCEICELGKIHNQFKTKCIKPPIEQCAKVSDSDQHLCIECLDNENFYLTQEKGKSNVVCVPRSSYQFDPTQRCLQRFNDSPRCKVCMKGLFSSFENCSIEANQQNNPKISEKSTIFYDFNTPYPQQISLPIVLQILYQEDCELFSEDNSTCLSCKKGMIFDNEGNCRQQTDFNCYLMNSLGECLKCISLMHYDSQSKKCILIDNFNICSKSSGTSPYCQSCLHNNPLDQDNNCMLGPSILHCWIHNEMNPLDKCDFCNNLYFLGEYQASCKQITQYQECFLSDGIIDKCQKCKNGFVFEEESELCVGQIRFDLEAGACTNRYFYRQKEQQGNENLCVPYSFLNAKQCFLLHPDQNVCLECNSGYYLLDNECHQTPQCLSTNGIDNFCFLGMSLFTYLNEFGQVMDVEDQNCFTNQIENKCLTCIFDENSIGVFMKDNTTCVSIQNIEMRYLDQCYSYREQNGKIVCDLCSSTYYPDSSGVCKEINDNRCEASDGRLDQCRLCYKLYVLSEAGFCIEREQKIPIPFCKTMKGNRCSICQSGYYLEDHFCQAISNPDCKISDGINNYCLACIDGFIIVKNSMGIYCFQEESQDTEVTIINKPCKYGFSLKLINEQVYVCAPQNILHCELEDASIQSCLKCSPGYFRSFKNYDYSSFIICRPITIDNCLEVGFDGRDCKQCKEGYSLMQSGQCFKQKYCTKYNQGICSECAENSYIQDGICKKIENCQLQHQKNCEQCLPGYWRKRRNRKENDEEGEISSSVIVNIKKFSRRTVDQIIKEEIDNIDRCYLIPHCNMSNGMSQTCKKCELGYRLIQGICVKEDIYLLENKNCRRFGLSKDDNQIVCLECQNLFYLDHNSCKSLENSPLCLLSDGINKNCLKCSYLGWIVSTFRGECELIPNCVISNGIDWCIQCGKDYVVDDSGMVCERLEVNIDNCEILSHQRIDSFTEVLSNSITDFGNKMVKQELRNFNTYLTTKGQVRNQDLALEPQASLTCLKCKIPYFLKNFQECNLVDSRQVNQSNCKIFDDYLQMCTICINGFFPKQQNSIISNVALCSKIHWHIKLRNLGCAIFNIKMECWQCLEAFYLDKYGFCQPRNVIMQKCKVFNPRKDECLECKSGYKLIQIESQQTSKIGICLGLEPHEQVENCAEYLPNTNKCIKCKKILKEKNVLEYVLNEELNVCEDVLGLMCREIDYLTKNCIKKYIENCEEYVRDSELATVGSNCVKCQKGYYLMPEGRVCLQNNPVDNCLVYSKTQRSVCEVCEEQYYLDKVAMKCKINSHKDCLVSMKEKDFCQICENSFTQDHLSGDCIKSKITNCQSSSKEKDNEEICLKCQNNFKIVDSGKTCLLELFDFNCKIFDSLSKCSECNDGYLLNHNGLCIAIVSSICQISSCLEYSIESTEEGLRCKKCLGNFFLDESHECKPLDPESDSQDEEANTAKGVSNGKKEEINQMEIEQRQSIISSILTLFIHLVILLVVVIGLIVCIRKQYLKKMEKKTNKEDQSQLEDEEDSQQHQQQPEQTSTEIQMDSTISIKGSLEYTLNQ